eukprot:4835373-Amphidinium_carterae.1
MAQAIETPRRSVTPHRVTGTLVEWRSDRDFGWVQPDVGHRQLALHRRDLPEDMPAVGTRLSFIVFAE